MQIISEPRNLFCWLTLLWHHIKQSIVKIRSKHSYFYPTKVNNLINVTRFTKSNQIVKYKLKFNITDTLMHYPETPTT